MLIKIAKGILTVLVAVGFITLFLAIIVAIVIGISIGSSYVVANPIAHIIMNIVGYTLGGIAVMLFLTIIGLSAYEIVDEWLKKLKIIK